MAYRAVILEGVLSYLRQCDRELRRTLGQAIWELQQDPRRSGAIQMEGKPRRHRYRVGDYRIIYEIDDKAIVICVVRIGDRKEIYR